MDSIAIETTSISFIYLYINENKNLETRVEIPDIFTFSPKLTLWAVVVHTTCTWCVCPCVRVCVFWTAPIGFYTSECQFKRGSLPYMGESERNETDTDRGAERSGGWGCCERKYRSDCRACRPSITETLVKGILFLSLARPLVRMRWKRGGCVKYVSLRKRYLRQYHLRRRRKKEGSLPVPLASPVRSGRLPHTASSKQLKIIKQYLVSAKSSAFYPLRHIALFLHRRTKPNQPNAWLSKGPKTASALLVWYRMLLGC